VVEQGDEADNTIDGTGLNDHIAGGLGADNLSGLGGNDVLFGEEGNDSIAGGLGDDVIYGDEGVDNLTGGAGNDVLNGGIGDDQLTGDDGNDILSGGEGQDTIRYIDLFDDHDTILDFSGSAGEGDKLEISSGFDVDIVEVDNDTEITITDPGDLSTTIITLLNVTNFDQENDILAV